ncbi:MAG: NUDIX domain-containing protein [Candidatus Doudnabacteria bacterium]|nr:NUDIX domain-containing protein [Candidatus Doudnabacteria bacterium]
MSIDPKDRFKIVVAVHLVLKKDGKVLLGKRQNTGWADGKFHLFGGHVDQGELVLDALKREGLEELGIKIDPREAKLVHVRSVLRSDHSRLHIYFEIHRWERELEIKEPRLCSELGWFDVNNLPENITRDSLESLTFIEKNINFHQTDHNE